MSLLSSKTKPSGLLSLFLFLLLYLLPPPRGFENVQGNSSSQNGHTVAPAHPAVDAPKESYVEGDLRTWIEKHKVLDTEVKELRKFVERMSAKLNQVVEKVGMMVFVLSATVSRVTMLETSLSQLVQMHIQMHANPNPPPRRFPIMIEPIDIDVEDNMEVGMGMKEEKLRLVLEMGMVKIG